MAPQRMVGLVMFGNEKVYRKRINKLYSGIYDIINNTNSESHLDTILFAGNWSLILNITKLNWMKDNGSDDTKSCLICGNRRTTKYNEHILFECKAMDDIRPQAINTISIYGRDRNKFIATNDNTNKILSFYRTAKSKFVDPKVDKFVIPPKSS